MGAQRASMGKRARRDAPCLRAGRRGARPRHAAQPQWTRRVRATPGLNAYSARSRGLPRLRDVRVRLIKMGLDDRIALKILEIQVF